MPTFCPGNVAYVSVGGTNKPFDSWSVSFNAELVDISDYNQIGAQFAAGLQSGVIILKGPYPLNALGIVQGGSYPVDLGITDTVYISLTLLVQSVKLSQSVRSVAGCEVTGVVNSNYPIEPTVLAL